MRIFVDAFLFNSWVRKIAQVLLVEKAWRITPGGRSTPAGFTVRPGYEADIDAELCGLRAKAETTPALANIAAIPLEQSPQPKLAVANAVIRSVGKPGANDLDDYFQSQALLDLKDPSGRIPYRIEVRCNRPKFLLSQDLVDLALNAVELALKVKQLDHN